MTRITMKRAIPGQLGLLVLLSLAATPSTAQTSIVVADADLSTSHQDQNFSSYWYQDSGPIVKNANECAPDDSRAVWSGRERLLGYVCTHNPNGA